MDGQIHGTQIADASIPIEALSEGAKTKLHVDYKGSVRVASTGDVDIATLKAGDTQDGIVLAVDNRILLKDQATGADRGIYDVHAAGPATRSPDFDEDVEVTAGLMLRVEEGTANEKKSFILATPDPITIGVTTLTFEEHPVPSHGLGDSASHSSATQAELNALVSDVDLVAFAGQLGGSAAVPDVRGIRETGGPTLLTNGAIKDGDALQRIGTALVGGRLWLATVGSSGDYADIKAAGDAYAASNAKLAVIQVEGSVDMGSGTLFVLKPIIFVGTKGTSTTTRSQLSLTQLIDFTTTVNSRLNITFINFEITSGTLAKQMRAIAPFCYFEFINCSIKTTTNANQSFMPAQAATGDITVLCRRCDFGLDDTTQNIFVVSIGVTLNLILDDCGELAGTVAGMIVEVVGASAVCNLRLVNGTKLPTLTVVGSGTLNLRRDGASEMPEANFPMTGGGTLTVERVAGDQLRETGGPTVLDVGAIAEGQFAKRVGSTFVGAVVTVRESLRNETGGEIPSGTLIAVSGFSVPEDRPLVVIADKDDAAKRPALAVTEAAVPNNTNFEGLVLGLLTGLNTSAFSANDQLALGDAGAVSRPPPETDPFTGEIQLIGSVVRSDVSNGSIYFTLSSGLLPMTAAQFFLVKETGPTGGVTGGEVTRATGLNVDVAAGSGFVNDDTDVFRPTWSAVTNLALTLNATNFIFVDKNGVVQASVSPPALGNNIILADAITDGSSVILLANHQIPLKEQPARNHEYVRDVVGNIVVSGLTTIKDAIALRLQVDTGTFYTRSFRVTVPATDPITFTYWFRDGAGGFTRVAGSTIIDKDNWDDGTGVLNSLIATEWKKDLLFVVFTATGAVEYHVFYGQEVFTSRAEAEAGNLPAADSDVITNGVRSGGIVIEGAAAAIASVVDVRPFLGQLSPGTTAVTDHGLLSGLADDDHSQYLLGDGTRAMSGSLDMGTNEITNVGNVDGVDISAHVGSGGAAHADVVPGGADGFMTGADKTKLDDNPTTTINTVTTTDNTVTTIATIPIADDTVNLIRARIVGRRTNAQNAAVAIVQAAVFRESAGSATLQGSDDITFDRLSDVQYDVQIIVSGNNALIQVEGDTGHTINWRCEHIVNSAS